MDGRIKLDRGSFNYTRMKNGKEGNYPPEN